MKGWSNWEGGENRIGRIARIRRNARDRRKGGDRRKARNCRKEYDGKGRIARKEEGGKIRVTILQLLFLILACVLLVRVYRLQIVEGAGYAENFELKITRYVPVKGTRGNIYDRNGEVLASNRLIYNILMRDEGSYASSRQRQLALNGMICRLWGTLQKNGDTLEHGMKIAVGPEGDYIYTVDGTALARFRADIFGVADPAEMTGEQASISAGEMVEFLAGKERFGLYGTADGDYTEEEREAYGLKKEYTREEILTIVGIRYMLSQHSFRQYEPVVVARDISKETMAAVLENNSIYPGISVEEDWERVYEGGEAFSHILGYTGRISVEELETAREAGWNYDADSIVGKAGVEQYFEEGLRGKDGEKRIIVNNVGKITGEAVMLEEPSAGEDLYLSIDKELQIAVYGMLERRIAEILSANLIPAMRFDKSHITDTDQIRIPVGDVYGALIENQRVDIGAMYRPEASEQEKAVAGKLEEKKGKVRERFAGRLAAQMQNGEGRVPEGVGPVSGGNETAAGKNTTAAGGGWTEEEQEYINLILSESGILKEDAVDKSDAVYAGRKKAGTADLGIFLEYAIEEGWVNWEAVTMEGREEGGAERRGTGEEGGKEVKTGSAEVEEAKAEEAKTREAETQEKVAEKYLTAGEGYHVLLRYIDQYLANSMKIQKSMLKYMIYSGELAEKDFCLLLYEQGVLEKDEAYLQLSEGEISAFSWVKGQIDSLRITPAQLALDPCSGAAVVVEEGTGKLLACVSYPGYDNNRLANGVDGTYYGQLLTDPSLPLYNRATQQRTAPGSTFKPVTAAAGMQEGVIDAGTEIICDGVFDLVDPPLRCWNRTGHGRVDGAAAALRHPCNDYLCEISYRLGRAGKEDGSSFVDGKALSVLQEYACLFDLDKKSGIELEEASPHVSDRYGIPSAIGQGTHNYTVVQLARYTNILASDGKSYRLSLVKGTEENGEYKEAEPVLQSEVELPERVWAVLREGMLWFARENAVLQGMEIEVAGKTGTAEESGIRPDHSLFIGYAPAQASEISVAVRIANGYGSTNATKVGRDILEFYFHEQ